MIIEYQNSREGAYDMRKHKVRKGDIIKSNIKSLIWIDKGEVFTVDGTVISEIDGKEGVSFVDRTKSKRVFWNTSDYDVISRKGNGNG